MVDQNISKKLKSKNIDETRNYFLEYIKKSELMSKNHESICTSINYIEHFLNLTSAITGCIWISAFTSLIGVHIGILQ